MNNSLMYPIFIYGRTIEKDYSFLVAPPKDIKLGIRIFNQVAEKQSENLKDEIYYLYEQHNDFSYLAFFCSFADILDNRGRVITFAIGFISPSIYARDFNYKLPCLLANSDKIVKDFKPSLAQLVESGIYSRETSTSLDQFKPKYPTILSNNRIENRSDIKSLLISSKTPNLLTNIPFIIDRKLPKPVSESHVNKDNIAQEDNPTENIEGNLKSNINNNMKQGLQQDKPNTIKYSEVEDPADTSGTNKDINIKSSKEINIKSSKQIVDDQNDPEVGIKSDVTTLVEDDDALNAKPDDSKTTHERHNKKSIVGRFSEYFKRNK